MSGELVKLDIAAPTIPDGTLALLAAAREITITAPEHADALGRIRKEAKSGRAAVVELYKPPKRSLDAAKQVVLDAEKRDVKQYDEVIEVADGKLVAWSEKLERERRAEAERLAKIERERVAAERAAEEERRLEAAAALEAAGKKAEADAVIAAPIVVTPAPKPVAQPPVAKIAGVTTRETWEVEIDSFPAFAAWCVASNRYDLLQGVNLIALRSMAIDAKSEEAAPPGIRFWKRVGIASR